MYEAYWGLKEKPFENTPDSRFLYHSEDSDDVFTRLLYTLKGNRGAALLTGESGCGKTLMARALVQELDPVNTEIALLTNPSWSAEEFLREILYQLGEDSQLETHSQIVHRLHEILYGSYEAGKETLVLIDEGQLIRDAAVFEEIRLGLNFQLNDAFLITLLLVGQPALAQWVQAYEPLEQRIATRGMLRPLQQKEVDSYIVHRLQIAGREEVIFSPDAVELVYRYSGGIQRKVNNIFDIALVIGYSSKIERIDGDWMQRLIQSESGNGA